MTAISNTFGVPQGSSLGPFQYNYNKYCKKIYIDDLWCASRAYPWPF